MKGRSWARWGASLIIHVLGVALLLSVPYSVQRHLSSRPPLAAIRLQAFIPPPPQAAARPVRAPSRAHPQPAPVIITAITPEPRHFELPKPVPPALPSPMAAEPPKIDAPVAPRIRAEIPAAALPAARPEPAVRTGVFKEETPSARPSAAKVVRMGGFGEGVILSPGEPHGRGLVRVGDFNGSSATGGAGGEPRGKGLAVGGAGFDRTASAGAGTGIAGGPPLPGGFDLPAAPKTAENRSPAGAAETPVEITYKPKPVYTEEARSRAVEGEVLLEVLFHATGRIEVLRVVRGLGFGLDASARAAAAGIRFRPGCRDGNPVDTRGVVHIVFQLS
ncbi:MAG: energy transducer TonB [Acidobacteriota bacterium]